MRQGLSCPVSIDGVTPVVAVKALRCSRPADVALLAGGAFGEPVTAPLRRALRDLAGNPARESRRSTMLRLKSQFMLDAAGVPGARWLTALALRTRAALKEFRKG